MSIIAVGQFTIRDASDITVGIVPPDSPTYNELWLDTSETPNVLKRWGGYDWTIVNDQADLIEAVRESMNRDGRNLLLESWRQQEEEISMMGTPLEIVKRYTDYGMETANGDTTSTFCVSFNWKFEWAGAGSAPTVTRGVGKGPGYCYILPYLQFGSGNNTAIEGEDLPIATGGSSGYYEGTFVQTAAQAAVSTNRAIKLMGAYVPAGYKISWWNVKLEKGIRATGWTPAPEDQDIWVNENRAAAEDAKEQVILLEETLKTEVEQLDKSIRQTVENTRTVLQGGITKVENRATKLEQDVAGFRADVDSFGKKYGTHILIDENAMTLTQNQAAGTGAVLTADALRFQRVQTDGEGHVTEYGEVMAEFGAAGAYADRLRSNETLSVGTEAKGWYEFTSMPTGVSEKWRQGTSDVVPLVITQQPQDALVALNGAAGDSNHPLDGSASWPESESVSLTVEAQGVTEYQWQLQYPTDEVWRDVIITGYNTKTLPIPIKPTTMETLWRCKLTGADGSVQYTNPAAVRTETEAGPVIVCQPRATIHAASGATVSIRFVASGDIASYHWQYRKNQSALGNLVSFTGSGNPQGSEKAFTVNHDREYIRCVVVGTDGSCAVTRDCLIVMDS